MAVQLVEHAARREVRARMPARPVQLNLLQGQQPQRRLQRGREHRLGESPGARQPQERQHVECAVVFAVLASSPPGLGRVEVSKSRFTEDGPCAGPEHTGQFRHGGGQIVDVMQCVHAQRAVKGAIGTGHLLRDAARDAHGAGDSRRVERRPAAGVAERHGIRIHRDDVVPEAREHFGGEA